MTHVRTRETAQGKRYDVVWREAGRNRSKSFTRRRDAEAYRLEVGRRLRLGVLYEAPPQTLREAYEEHRARYEVGRAPSTVERRRQAWPALSALAGLPLHHITYAAAEDAVLAVARRAPRQAQQALALLKAVLRDAQARGQRIDPAVLALRTPGYAERAPRYLTLEELDTLCSWCTEPLLVKFAALSGLRQGELFALRDGDLHLEGEAHVLVARSAYKGAERTTKSKRRRRVYLAPEAAQVLREQLLARPAGTTLVFPAPRGGIWRPDNFMGRVFRPARRRAGLEGLTFHDLRHTYASLMVAAGANPLQIAEALGHVDKQGQPDATLVWRRYGHLYPGSSRQAAEALGAYLTTARATSKAGLR